MGTQQDDPLRGALFVLVHFKTLRSIINRLPSCLFPSIVENIHIIDTFTTSSIYEHFQTELNVISKLLIQVQECVAWSLFSLSFDVFNTPSHFITPSKGINVLGVPFGTSSFTSSFIKYALLEGV
jgi:hypothetical protein